MSFERIFEWDQRKAAINLATHGISFEDAELVFLDPRHTIALTGFPVRSGWKQLAWCTAA